MPAVEVSIANALVTELNSGSWTQSFTAVRSWVPIRKDGDLSTLRVAVVPLTLTVEQIARQKESREYGFAIVLQKQCDLDIDTTTVADAMAVLTEELHNFFSDDHQLTGLTGYRVRDAVRPEIFSPDLMNNHAIWFAEIDLVIGSFR